MPRGVYKRKSNGGDAPKSAKKSRRGGADSYAKILAAMRAAKAQAEDRVVALGTAIEAMESLE